MPRLHRLRRTLTHDWPGILLVSATLAMIGLYLGLKPAPTAGNGHRVIDFKVVSALMEKGDLSRREARWYQAGPVQGTAGDAPKENQTMPGVSNVDIDGAKPNE